MMHPRFSRRRVTMKLSHGLSEPGQIVAVEHRAAFQDRLAGDLFFTLRSFEAWLCRADSVLPFMRLCISFVTTFIEQKLLYPAVEASLPWSGVPVFIGQGSRRGLIESAPIVALNPHVHWINKFVSVFYEFARYRGDGPTDITHWVSRLPTSIFALIAYAHSVEHQ